VRAALRHARILHEEARHAAAAGNREVLEGFHHRRVREQGRFQVARVDHDLAAGVVHQLQHRLARRVEAFEVPRRLRGSARARAGAALGVARRQRQAHRLVLDARLLEALAIGDEAELLVETDRIDLRVQRDFRQAELARLLDQRQQQGLAHAASAPFLQHRHAPDLVLGREPAGADRAVRVVARDHVPASGIEFVPFQFQRHLLLDHEHGLAHAAQVLKIDLVIGRLDAEAGVHELAHQALLGLRGRAAACNW
jgi:hypothetical protein